MIRADRISQEVSADSMVDKAKNKDQDTTKDKDKQDNLVPTRSFIEDPYGSVDQAKDQEDQDSDVKNQTRQDSSANNPEAQAQESGADKEQDVDDKDQNPGEKGQDPDGKDQNSGDKDQDPDGKNQDGQAKDGQGKDEQAEDGQAEDGEDSDQEKGSKDSKDTKATRRRRKPRRRTAGDPPVELNDLDYEGTVTIIGDCLTVGIRTYLQENIPDSTVYGVYGMAMDAGYNYVRDLIAQGLLGKNVVIELGTNQVTHATAYLNGIIEALPEGHRLILITPHIANGNPEAWGAYEVTRYERTLAKEAYYPFVTVFDWSEYASTRPELYTGTDLIHFCFKMSSNEPFKDELIKALQRATARGVKTKENYTEGRKRLVEDFNLQEN